MLKKSFLTPVLAGVLAVAVVGSGAAYYATYVKDSDSADKNSKDENKTQITVDDAAAVIEDQLDKAQQIANGELDVGYKAEVSYTAPASGDLSEIGNVSLALDAKQKDKMSEVDYSLGYNSQNVISANVVYDNESETAYLKIPELSDAYLTGTADEINTLLESLTGSSSSSSSYIVDDDDYDYDYDYDYGTDSLYTASAFTQTAAADDSAPDLDALKDIDFTALFADLEDYGTVIIDNAPAATDGENRTGEVDGASYDLTTKVYTVTKDDAQKICDAIAEKGKSDETLKSTLTSLGVSDSDYDSIWSSLTDLGGDDATVTLDVYYVGDDIAGWQVTDEDGKTAYMITANTGDSLIVDWNLEDDVTAKGAVSCKDNVLDGTITAEFVDGSDKSDLAIDYDNLSIDGDAVKGAISVKMSENGTEELSATVTLDNTAEKVDTAVAVTADGTDVGTVQITAQQTDATDITVPTGTAYSLSDSSQLEAYANSCDIEGWAESLQTVLGDELYNSIFGYSDTTSGSYDYDVDDYDFS